MPLLVPRISSLGASPSVPELAAIPRPPVALVVNDREWAARSLEAALAGEGYATLRVATADEAAALCAAARPDVVFIEQRLAIEGVEEGGTSGEPGGLALCRRLRRDRLVSDAVATVVTTVDVVTRPDLLAALDAGAWDLFSLFGDATLLLARCALWVRAKRHADAVAELALADLETGLYNLTGLLRRARESERAMRRAPGRPSFACAAFALTGSWGGVRAGVEGAEPLRRLRDAWLAVGRGTDTFARVGPADFALLAPATTGPGAGRLVARLRDTLAAVGAGGPGGDGLRLVVHTLEPGDVACADDVVELVMRAVSALAMAR